MFVIRPLPGLPDNQDTNDTAFHSVTLGYCLLHEPSMHTGSFQTFADAGFALCLTTPDPTKKPTSHCPGPMYFRYRRQGALRCSSAPLCPSPAASASVANRHSRTTAPSKAGVARHIDAAEGIRGSRGRVFNAYVRFYPAPIVNYSTLPPQSGMLKRGCVTLRDRCVALRPVPHRR